MSAISNSVTIEKRDSNNARVLWSTSKAIDAFKDADITLSRSIGAHISATTKFTVSNTLAYFILQAYGSAEEISINNNVNNFSKTFTSNNQTSGNCFFYLSDLNTTSFNIEFSSAGNTFSGGNFRFNRVFPNLKSIEAAVSLASYRFSFSNNQDWNKLPSLAYFYGNHSTSLSNCPTLRNGMIGSMDQNSLSTNYNNLRRLFTLAGDDWEISKFFNGNPLRSSLSVSSPNTGTTVKPRYRNKAHFPLIIGQDLDYPLPCIIDVAGFGTIAMPSDELSQMLIDFANQVTAVNIKTKLLKLKGSPNTSYSDPAQPISTYQAAVARITNSLSSEGLGCTLTIIT